MLTSKISTGVGDMVKAVFHKNQRVFVTPVGTWASIERVIPHWVKGIEEPLRIYYDCGLGREFGAHELTPERNAPDALECSNENWGVFRRENRWQSADDTAHHPVPGTHPVVVTSDATHGGWRVPAAEYAAAPERYEAQARVIAAAPRLMRLAKILVQLANEYEDELPHAIHEQARIAARILAEIQDETAALSHEPLAEDPSLDQDGNPPLRTMQPAPAKPQAPQFSRQAPPTFSKQAALGDDAIVSPALRRTQPTR